MKSPTLKDYLLLSALSLIWASAFFNIKIATYSYGPITIACLRILFGAIPVILLCMYQRIKIEAFSKDWKWFAAIGFINLVIPFFLIAYGVQKVQSNLAAILMSSTPISATILAHIYTDKEKINFYKIIGILLGFSGIVYLFSDNLLITKDNFFSALMILLGSTFYVIGGILTLKISHKKNETKFLEDLECIDIGCGGGILSERLSRLGARVTGIDASESSINVAKEHSFKSRLEIDYKCLTTSELLRSKINNFLNKFDIVIASEVIEHVNERKIFLSDVSKLSRSGGLIVFTTINKSFLGILLGKFFAENILKVVPLNTHDPNKFISPQKLTSEAEKHNIILDNFVGFVPTLKINNILKKEFGDFRLSSNIDVNYGAAGIRL